MQAGPMHSVYQETKSPLLGVNSCQGCLDKQREIDRLKDEIQSLRVQLSKQKRKDKAGFFGSSTPSSQLPLKANSKPDASVKRGGAKPGHIGNGRKKHPPDEVDEIREISTPPICSICRVALLSKGYRQRSVLDIDPVTVRKVLYRIQRKVCPSCGVEVTAPIKDVLPKALLSNQLMAEIVDSHYLQGMPLGRVCARWQLNYGTVIEALHRISAYFEPVMKDLKQAYQKAFVRHADETTWRIDGKSGYCWLFASDRVSLHLYRNTRSARVVEEVFGQNKKLVGYLVVDRYAAYKRAGCRIQYCYAHLLRELLDLQSEFSDEQEVEAYSKTMAELLTQAMRLQSSRPDDKQYYREAVSIKQAMLLASREGSKHLAVKRWQDFFVEESDHLYHWVEERRVPCENNRAERELRPTVIARKVSHGSQAEEGAKTREVLMSVMQTLKKRVQDPRQRFKEALDKMAANAQIKASQALFGINSS
jgi:transposase